MADHLQVTPLLFDPTFEQVPDDEAKTIEDLTQAMREIIETTYAEGGHAIRSVHAKSHGLLQGEIEILPNLPAELAQGAFAQPGRLPVVMRFSTNPGDILDDKVSTPRGLAIKLIGVEGERLPNSDGLNQDFVMVNAPAFMVPTPQGIPPIRQAGGQDHQPRAACQTGALCSTAGRGELAGNRRRRERDAQGHGQSPHHQPARGNLLQCGSAALWSAFCQAVAGTSVARPQSPDRPTG